MRLFLLPRESLPFRAVRMSSAPYETVKLVSDIVHDVQPGGLWNQQATPSGSTAAAIPNAGATNSIDVKVSGYHQPLPLLKIGN
jgi:hypothetical protein